VARGTRPFFRPFPYGNPAEWSPKRRCVGSLRALDSAPIRDHTDGRGHISTKFADIRGVVQRRAIAGAKAPCVLARG